MNLASDELVDLARGWIVAAYARDAESIAERSHSDEPTAIHTIAFAAQSNLTVRDLVTHLKVAPPRQVLDSNPSGYMHGDIAWLLDFPKIDLLEEGVLDARVSLVFHRVDGVWLVVHAHLSKGVTNAGGGSTADV